MKNDIFTINTDLYSISYVFSKLLIDEENSCIMKKITINGIEYLLYCAGENTAVSIYPHMVEASSGKIPKGKQLGLLKGFLEANGVTPIDNANTHWCVETAMKIDGQNANIKVLQAFEKGEKKEIPLMEGYLPISIANIEKQDQLVRASDNYGKEALIIHDVLNAFPDNTDLNTVAMKIAVIDVTNSTHLAQKKSLISLYDISKLIINIKDFDVRLQQGDPDLVNDIAKNTGAINLFSFATKYCTYHNVEIYGRDDYSIYDGIVKEALPHYVRGLSVHKIDTWRRSYNYAAFNECIGKLLDDCDIHISFRRRKFDHFLWYTNR